MGEEVSGFLRRCTASSIVTIAENRAPCIYDKMATAVFRFNNSVEL